MESNGKLMATWNYSSELWNRYVTVEKNNKKQDNIYLGIGILIPGTLALVFFRDASVLVSLLFVVPIAILIPLLKMKFSYPYLKNNIQHPRVDIYEDHLIINQKKIELKSKKRRIKSIKILEARNDVELLEFNVQWMTGKGPTNDEFRIPIPKGERPKALELIDTLG